MFDQLCRRSGYHDNAILASLYCSRIGKTGGDDFESVQKNLRNWRVGRHLPLRRNHMLLAELLGVKDDRELRHQWDTLYAAARADAAKRGTGQAADGDGEMTEPHGETAAPPAFRGGRVMSWLAVALAVAIGGGVGWHSFAKRSEFHRLPLIGYDARVKMVVGETRLIHGDRGDCGGDPPDWYYILPQVPASTLGIFSDGGTARKMDNGCNAVVRARAVRFTAVTAGSEEIKLLGDYMKIVVTDRGYPREE